MKHLFQDVTKRLEIFLAQRNALVLLLQCRDEDCPILFKALETADEMSSGIFWIFHENFTDPRAYALSLVESFQKRMELLQKELEESGEPAWPPLPPQLTNPMTLPAERLRLLFMYARTRIPNMEGSHLTVALMPLQISQPLHWRAFVRELMEYNPEAPWCHHMRFFVREPLVTTDSLSPELQARLDPATFPSTEVYSIDFRPDALHKAIKEEMGDPTVPLPERMQYLLMDASLDSAHKRYLIAGEKYQLLRRYYTATKNPALLAITLNALGELHARFPRLRDQAMEYFDMAITAAMEAECFQVLLNVALNLGNLYFTNKEWAQALEHFEAAKSVAEVLLNVGAAILCLENIGMCQYKLEQWGPAQKTWQEGLEIARATDEEGMRRKLLEHLRDMYKTARMRDRLAATEEELRSLP